MRLKTDECRILSIALGESIFELIKNVARREETHHIIDQLRILEKKLHDAGQDQRRKGRSSQNTFADTLKRYKGGEQ
jgi:hypothetical protein